MDINLQPGKYIVAVSGGVDSVALLDALQREAAREQPVKIIVAHYDHGIRNDSTQDRQHVQNLARGYNLPFVYDEGRLGSGASEADARTSRYKFLHQVRGASGASAIITAHHQDDLLETAILNILRGTGRKGLTALGSQPGVVRPFIAIPKQDLINYAQANGLVWREDSTNVNQAYLRNYIRHTLLPRFDTESRQKLIDIITSSQPVNNEIDQQLINMLHVQSQAKTIDRTWFQSLPHDVSLEVMAAWLRAHGIRDFDRKTLERLVVMSKVGQNNSKFSLIGDHLLNTKSGYLALTSLER